ncbi:MAG TPA: cupin domain-containing protein [Bradyrhizobium sp.]|uniref:cupin domain-containing protein n=1 Tax=Bradyrhizobium sp. TaxID=376 RepID=UPI002D80D018|nr:cupin domain-containing protein [Bradyrhizobium sp.]HET7886218.1 cupin domain-containing protein [Bradyrhizobium sp.]
MLRMIRLIAVACMVGSAADASEIRRVVTGLDADNKAVVLFDSQMPLQAGPLGLKATNLWVTNSYPLGFSFKDDTASIPVGISPLDNGTKFRVVEFPPLDAATEAKMEPGALMKAVGPVAPARGRPVIHPLMHRTRSVDYAVVLSGEIDMVLDESIVHLRSGDTIVQQATNHAWVNHGTETCRILFVLMDSKQP